MVTLDKSKDLFDKARVILPGGVSSPVRAIKPYPFYTESANGCRIKDIDGNEYIDYCLAYGPNILGHANPVIKQAIIDQLDKGWLYGTPTGLEVTLAEKIASLYPSIDMLRFVSTGTEATMSALRAARGFTRKNKFVKIEGGFHGAHDAVLVKAGSGATTHGKPDSLGIPEDFTKNTLQVAYNDIEAMTEVIESNQDDMAAVIIEPVLGNIGPILPEGDYLKEVRKVTEENDVVLIFDEVITGFRLAMGGAQEYFGVTPDMTTLGKIVGGGLPIGVFGGKREILDMISPSGSVYQAGTFSGSPASVAAGIAAVDILEKEKVHEKLEATGNMLRAGLNDIIADKGLDYHVGGIASMFKVFFGDKPLNYQDVLKCDKEGYLQFFHDMLDSNVFLPPSQFETNFLSTAHTEADLETTLEAYAANLK
ncbi:glutamate-1-semialdehyde 2,1-aminomutase [Methanococcoides alaskense]|uniref:Glutamate-1-semialdehyde 2,1-aminomutase n=1 Tax=Methanococcoides alaskense TaxID=325778 RepID=A0AA90Z654_9EURY|nr:glutamate-1-semialdehyde 2,1-aminomutase [Methanococcoides alaskense]MDA0525237.1 glutamate-1-semialdehyde 2,1-aminomutase [Methanococcoides alaskense]MDR6221840.1 glutamate-1-semialdehyde 2,1-aminomutase [Methanococcoides alaskense]